MQFSLLNLIAFTTFAAWLTVVFQADFDSRCFYIFGTAALTTAVSMLLALCSPVGDGELEVNRNSFFVVLFSFTKFVVLFAVAVIATLIACSILGFDERVIERWLRQF